MKYKYLDMQDYVLKNSYQYVEMFVYTVISFFLPLFVGHPQLLVGILVNAMLVAGALNLKSNKLLPLIIAPSLGALSRGALFGPFTIFLLYMAPFIWLGNGILVYCFKYFKLHKKLNYWLTLVIGSGLKAGFLFGIAYVMFTLGLVPAMFLTAMGVLQLTTALAGGFFAYGFQAAKKKFTI